MWRRDGRELFYLALENTLMAVRLGSDTPLDAGTPAPLFKLRIEESLFPDVRNHYAVTSDGQRFLVKPSEEQPVGYSEPCQERE